MSVPLPSIFEETKFLVFYKDKIYGLSETRQEDWVKIYGKKYGLKEINWEKTMKQYYKKNKKTIKKIIRTEIKKIKGKSIEEIIQEYKPEKKFEDFLYVDDKVYNLTTMKEWVSRFKEYFGSDYYEKMEDKAGSAGPEDLSKYLRENEEEYYGNELNKVCDKIWTNDRTVQIMIGGEYLMHLFDEDADGLINDYGNWIKLDKVLKAVKKT